MRLGGLPAKNGSSLEYTKRSFGLVSMVWKGSLRNENMSIRTTQRNQRLSCFHHTVWHQDDEEFGSEIMLDCRTKDGYEIALLLTERPNPTLMALSCRFVSLKFNSSCGGSGLGPCRQGRSTIDQWFLFCFNQLTTNTILLLKTCSICLGSRSG